MKDLILLLSADNDIQRAYDRYEELQTGRGELFYRHLDAALTLLRNHPELGPPYRRTYRRLVLRDFPFGIFYENQPARIVVAAVLDLRQDPQAIRRRLSGR